MEDRRVTLRELAAQVPEVCEKTIDNILTEKLGYRKVCARWVPHMLTETHKENRVKCAQSFLQEIAENTEEFLDSIVTGDETWCHYVTPETKNQSRQWKHPESPRLKKFKQTLSAGGGWRVAAEFFEEGIQKWITRQEKCVQKSGDYIEK